MALTRPTTRQLITTTLSFSDPISVLNKDATSADQDVGFIINRDGGGTANVAIYWDETNDRFNLVNTTSSGATNSNVAISSYANLNIHTLDALGSVATAKVNITNTSLDDSILITTTEASSTAGPVVSLKRNSASPADGDYLGQINFKGENDADQEIVYSKITGKVLDASDGTEDGILEFAFMKAGSQNISARFRSDSLQLINGTTLTVNGLISTESTITAGGLINTAGNVSGAVVNAGTLTTTGLLTSGNILASGNVTAPYYFGNGSQLSGVITSVTKIINGTSDITAYSGGNVAVTVGGTANTVVFSSAYTEIKGPLIPSANLTYDLGSPTRRWRDAYFSGSTIYLGNAVLSSSGQDIIISTTGGFGVPVGTTAERTTTTGAIRFNTDQTRFETYDGTTWNTLAYGTVSDFPSGDYGDVTTVTSDAFGVPLATTFDMNESGAVTTTDLGAAEAYVGA
jgi:hypothetical protein